MRSSGLTPVTKPKKQYGSAKGRKRVSTYSRQQSNYVSKKQSGGRHADKATDKRSSRFFTANKPVKRSTTSKRSSSFFGSSSRSSRSSGGK